MFCDIVILYSEEKWRMKRRSVEYYIFAEDVAAFAIHVLFQDFLPLVQASMCQLRVGF